MMWTRLEHFSRSFQTFFEFWKGIINFEEYLIGVGLTSNNSTPEQKLSFALKMYDIDGDRELSISEVEKMINGLNQFSGNNKLNQTDHPKNTVKRIFAKYDKDENGSKFLINFYFKQQYILYFIYIHKVF